MRKVFIGFALMVLLSGSVFAADPAIHLSLGIAPNLAIPIAGDEELFTTGVGIDLAGYAAFRRMPKVNYGVLIEYGIAPLNLKFESASLSLVSGGVCLLFEQPIAGKISLRAYGAGGYFAAFFNDDMSSWGSGPLFTGGLGVALRASPRFSLEARGSYRYYMQLYNDVSVSVGALLHLGDSEGGE